MNHLNFELIRCSLPADSASKVVLDNLRQQGLICADHTLRKGDKEIAALLQSEIDLLREAGIVIEVLNRVKPAFADNTVETDITTGFVSTYLDAADIHSTYATL